jgi:DNA repair exonuclease SbcCD ATPase subunit
MKRAVGESRELKKELMLMRQEKEELKKALAEQKQSEDRLKFDLMNATRKKSDDKKVLKEMEKLQVQTQENEEKHLQLEQEMKFLLARANEKLDEKQRRVDQLEKKALQNQEEIIELKKTIEELKRKSCKTINEKQAELQKHLYENEQLSKHVGSLQDELDEVQQAMKVLEKQKEKSIHAMEELTERIQKSHKEELDKMMDKCATMAQEVKAGKEEKAQIVKELKDAEDEIDHVNTKLKDFKRQQEDKYEQLVDTTKSLQEKLLIAVEAKEEAIQEAEDAKCNLKEQVHLRSAVEKQAQRSELHAQNLQRDLDGLRENMIKIEKALNSRGITMDFLLEDPRGLNNTSKGEEKNTITRKSSIKVNLSSTSMPTKLPTKVSLARRKENNQSENSVDKNK